jgi:dTDP-4-dehydrorhamnose reductase
MSQAMRLLIAGKQGQLAQALAEAALSHPDIEASGAGRDTLDICESRSVERVFSDVSPSIVVNAAAYTAVDKAETDESHAYALNRDGAGLLALAAARRDIPIVHVSTDYVYDGRKSGPYVEEDLVAPASVYGRSKLEGEIAVRDANPRHLILRTAWVYSPTGRNFVKTMLGLAATRDRLNVVDDQHGNPTYAPHLAVAILDLVRQIGGDQKQPWGIYHVTGTGTTTWCGLAREVFCCSRELGGPWADVDPISTADYPTPAQRPANSRLDCGKIRRTFGICLPEWHEGVADCVTRLVRG